VGREHPEGMRPAQRLGVDPGSGAARVLIGIPSILLAKKLSLPAYLR
jgi:hypothetical protein